MRSLQRAILVVFANSQDLGFEQTIKAALAQTPALDWPDYAAQGATLRDYPDYPQNPHGPWLRLDNAAAMARAMAAELVRLGLPSAVIQANRDQFERELNAQQGVYARLAQDHRLRETTLLLMIPGLCDLVANLDVHGVAVLMAEGSGTVSGQRLSEAVTKLKSGEYGGIVCPLSMVHSKQGEAARQVAADSGAPIAYVRFQDTDLAQDTYLSVSAYNAAALAGLSAPRAAIQATCAPSRLWLWLTVLIIIALLVGLKLGRGMGKRLCPHHGAGIFDQK